MPMFVDTAAVPVTDGENTIWIKPRMGVGTEARVKDQLYQRGQLGGVEVHLHAYNVALLVHNIVRWEGPAFKGVPLTAASIEQLDPDEPLVDMVLAEITSRNEVRPTGIPEDPKVEANGASATLSADA